MKRVLFAIGLLVLMTARPAHAATYQVGIANFGYHTGVCPTPAGSNLISIKVGETITWTNCDAAVTHTVTADDKSFDSGNLITKSFSWTFVKPSLGIAYHCSIHPDTMRGTVVVKDVPTPSTKPTAPPATTTTAPNLTTTTSPSTTATLGNVFEDTTTTFADESTTTSEPDTTPIENKDGGANGALVAVTLIGIAAVIGGGVSVVRRMRGTSA